MEQKIDYNDNIFLLSNKFKLIEDGLKLNLDTADFIPNIKSELSFIASGIEKYFNTLIGNKILLNRTESLKSLKRLIRKFINLLQELTDPDNKYYTEFSDLYEKFNEYTMLFNDFEDQIKEIITDYSYKSQDEKLIISENEYKVLFSNENEEE